MTFIRVQSLNAQPAEKVVKVISNVAKQFHPIIFLLSATGPYGIGVDKPFDEKQKVIYEVRKLSWKRPLSVYSLFSLFWMVFCVCIMNFDIVLDIPSPIDFLISSFDLPYRVTLRSAGAASGEITLSEPTNRLLHSIVLSCRLIEFTGLFFSAPRLAQWLNELTEIEIDFNAHFSLNTQMSVNITRLRNYLATFYFILPGAFWMVAYLWTFSPQYQFNWNYSVMGYIWLVSVVFYGVGTELIEDMKMILMLETSRLIYSQMRSGVRQEVSIEEISEKNVVAWDGLITKLRGHLELTGECMKTQLMLNILETVIVLSFGTFMVIRSVSGYNRGANMYYAITIGFFCVVLAARLYVKVAIAENIYAEETLLMEDLKDSELRVRATSTDALFELRNLQESVMLAPTRIRIGSFCNLDNKLLVQVIIQTIPMLIAVAQFHDLG